MGGEPAVGEEDGRGGVDGEEERRGGASSGEEIKLRGRGERDKKRVVNAATMQIH